MIWETLEQQRSVLDSLQLLGRGHSSSARKQYHGAAARRKEELHNSTKHALRTRYDGADRHDARGDVSYDQAGWYSTNHYTGNYSRNHPGQDQPEFDDLLDNPASQLSPIVPNSARALLIQDSLALVEKRIRDFKEMNELASDLQLWVCEGPPFWSPPSRISSH